MSYEILDNLENDLELMEDTLQNLQVHTSKDAIKVMARLKRIKGRALEVHEAATEAIAVWCRPEHGGRLRVKMIKRVQEDGKVLENGPYVYHIYHSSGERHEPYLGKAKQGTPLGMHDLEELEDILDQSYQADDDDASEGPM